MDDSREVTGPFFNLYIVMVSRKRFKYTKQNKVWQLNLFRNIQTLEAKHFLKRPTLGHCVIAGFLILVFTNDLNIPSRKWSMCLGNPTYWTQRWFFFSLTTTNLRLGNKALTQKGTSAKLRFRRKKGKANLETSFPRRSLLDILTDFSKKSDIKQATNDDLKSVSVTHT